MPIDISQFKVWTEEEFDLAFPDAPMSSKTNGAGGWAQGGNLAAIDEATLPDDLLDLIRNGVTQAKDRSRAFMGAVARLKQSRASVDAIFDLLSKYPDGIASKYLRPKNRLRREVERAYDKLPDAPPVFAGGAGAAPDPNLGPPMIEVRQGRITKIVNEAEAALLKSGLPIFERAGVLVYPVISTLPASHDRKTDMVLLKRLTVDNIVYLLNQDVARFVKHDGRKREWADINPPREAASILISKGQWSFPNVAGVITVPTLRPDGSLLDQPGYDEATQLYFTPDRWLDMPAIKAAPSRDDALAALAFLDGLLDEFPFVTPLDRSVALAALMAPVLRGAFEVGPFDLFRAPRMGSGKSYLMEIMSTILSGQPCPVLTYANSKEEMKKQLGSLILEGATIISLDNCEEDIGGELLCQIATEQVVRIRILGQSQTPACRWRGTIGGNGNNVGIRSDMARRTLIVNLDTGLERPEQKRFKANPVRQASENRGLYMAAILTIARAWRVAEAQGGWGASGLSPA